MTATSSITVIIIIRTALSSTQGRLMVDQTDQHRWWSL